MDADQLKDELPVHSPEAEGLSRAVPGDPIEGPVEHLCNLVCAFGLLAMVVIVVIEVVTRNLLDFSFQLSDELGGYIVAGISFISLAVCQVTHSYHHVEFLRSRLPPRGRFLLSILFDCASLGVCFVLVWQLVRFDLTSWRSEDVAPTVLLTPLWIPQITMPLGAIALTISVARTTWADIRRLMAWA